MNHAVRVPWPDSMTYKVEIPKSVQVFYEHLRKTHERIDATLAKWRIEKPYAKKDYSLQSFAKMIQFQAGNIATAFANIESAINSCGNFSSTTTDLSHIEACCAVIRDGIEEIRKSRETIAAASVELSWVHVKERAIGMCDAVLVEFCRFVCELKQSVELHGTMADEPIRIDLHFEPQIDELANRIHSAIQAISAGTSPTTAVGGSDQPCFVAGAIYGDPTAWQVTALREFRDSVLIRRRFGRFAIGVYYVVGPWCADLVRRNARLRTACRRILDRLATALSANRADGTSIRRNDL